ncbi:MAG TPA: universal stress protein [Polyangiaceae bacterium]|jgi:nucleotide-binding universal stress UspA family protein|nr:universal stress protein [Polyangiaceae bacterium]
MSTEAQEPLRNAGEDVRVIVVALDASNGATNVLAAAARVSRGGAALHVAHVFKSSRLDHARAGAPHTSSEAVHDAKDYLEGYVKSARAQTRSDVTGHFLVGDPTTEILQLCDKLSADLLVVGTHEYHGLERLILGSIAETLVRKAHCSVFVSRSKKAGT